MTIVRSFCGSAPPTAGIWAHGPIPVEQNCHKLVNSLYKSSYNLFARGIYSRIAGCHSEICGLNPDPSISTGGAFNGRVSAVYRNYLPRTVPPLEYLRDPEAAAAGLATQTPTDRSCHHAPTKQRRIDKTAGCRVNLIFCPPAIAPPAVAAETLPVHELGF